MVCGEHARATVAALCDDENPDRHDAAGGLLICGMFDDALQESRNRL